jgi:hypothetical protein
MVPRLPWNQCHGTQSQANRVSISKVTTGVCGAIPRKATCPGIDEQETLQMLLVLLLLQFTRTIPAGTKEMNNAIMLVTPTGFFHGSLK